MGRRTRRSRNETPPASDSDEVIEEVREGEPVDAHLEVGRILVGEEVEYYVEAIEKYFVNKAKKDWFWVKWLGWSRAHNTWEVSHNMEHSTEMVEEYFAKNPKDAVKRRGVLKYWDDKKKKSEKHRQKRRQQPKGSTTKVEHNMQTARMEPSISPKRNANPVLPIYTRAAAPKRHGPGSSKPPTSECSERVTRSGRLISPVQPSATASSAITTRSGRVVRPTVKKKIEVGILSTSPLTRRGHSMPKLAGTSTACCRTPAAKKTKSGRRKRANCTSSSSIAKSIKEGEHADNDNEEDIEDWYVRIGNKNPELRRFMRPPAPWFMEWLVNGRVDDINVHTCHHREPDRCPASRHPRPGCSADQH